jgi:hypothetical protein
LLGRNQEIKVSTIHRVIVLITCSAMLLANAILAQAVPPAQVSVTTTVAAPIFASAYSSKTPLAMARQGSRLTVLDESPDWYHVTFKGPGDGRSDGYIRIGHVALVPLNSSRVKPAHVSVSDNTFETQRTYHTLRAHIRRRFEQSSRLTPPIGDARYRREIGTIDEPRSELKQDMTLDGFQMSGDRRFRY